MSMTKAVSKKNRMLIKQNPNTKSIWKHMIEDFRYSFSIFSVSGLNQAVFADKRTLLERIFWLAIVVLCTLVGLWQGFIVYDHYEIRPVIITVEKNFREWQIEYPSVTYCFRELIDDLDVSKPDKILQKLNLSIPLKSTKDAEDFYEYLTDLAFSDYMNYDKLEVYANGSKKDWLPSDRYLDVLDQAVKSYGLKRGKTHRLDPPKNPGNKGFATFQRIFTELGPCEALNPWAGLYSTKEFFNSKVILKNYTRVLFNIIDVPVKWTMTNLRFNEDFIWIFFHSAHEIIDISNKISRTEMPAFHLLMVEFDSNIVIISPEAEALTVRQKSCRMPFDVTELPLKHSPIYSRNICRIECKIKMAMKFCNCTPYYYRRLEDEPICNMSGLFCLSQYKELFLHPPECDCPQNCNTSTYFLKTIVQTNPFAYAAVFAMELSMPPQIYVRNLIFTPIDLAVQIGGILGLFLGASTLSIVEVGYALTIRLYFGLYSRIRENKSKLSISFTH